MPLDQKVRAVLSELRECMVAENTEPDDSEWKPIAWWAEAGGISRCQAERYLKLGVKLGKIERKDGYLRYGCGRRKATLYRPKSVR